MKKTILIFLIIAANPQAYAQLSPAPKVDNPSMEKKSGSNKVTIKNATLPADTATVPKLNITTSADNNFDPNSGKLRNLPVKTPVYNNNVTGTASPGDARTGIPVNSNPLPKVHPNLKDSIKHR